MHDNYVEILLVEDNLDEARLTIRTLNKGNFGKNLLHLRDGEEALNFLFHESFKQPPKLILLDLKMPKVDGIEVLRKIKSDPLRKSIPVVMMTSSREERDIVESYALGVNAFIVKPVDTQQFTEVVTKLGLFWLSINTTHS
jgi:two-component system, response regulator